MKKYYIVRYDEEQTSRIKKDTLPEAVAVAESMAKAAPGKTVCVFQVKKAVVVDTSTISEVDLVD